MKTLDQYPALVKFINLNKCFKIRGEHVVCNVCLKPYVYVPNEGVAPLRTHLTSKIHLRNVQSGKKQSPLAFECIQNPNMANQFDVALVKALSAANIPLIKLENEEIKNFFRIYTGIDVKSESWYRKILLEKIYEEDIQKRISKYLDKDIYIMFDETTDSTGRYILHLLFGACDGEKRDNPILVKTVELSKTNSLNIYREIINFLAEFYKGTIQYEKIRLLLSDAAPYAVKVGTMLKELIPNLKHITCICHLLHRLCEEVRKLCPRLNRLASELKRLLVKNKTNQNIYCEITSLKIPKFPVLTRWGSWIEFAYFINHNYECICRFFAELHKDDYQIADLFINDENQLLINELKFASKFIFLTKSITKLESNDLSTEEQITILKDVEKKLVDEKIIAKMNTLCNKNPDLSYFYNFCATKSEKKTKSSHTFH